MEVRGNCPMGCGEGLILSELGGLLCADLLCSRRAAAQEILADAEAGHVVTFTDEGFIIQHPLRERLDGSAEVRAARLPGGPAPGPVSPRRFPGHVVYGRLDLGVAALLTQDPPIT